MASEHDPQEVRFTEHAEEQLVLRELDRAQVIAVALAPEQVVYPAGKPPIAQSRVTFKGKPALLRVAFTDQDNTRLIITVYPTTQFERYWNKETDNAD
ncbi:MAG: DUF4258 domain-containing protein [Anaerolineae bacterium]|nr:DUF4258 domain-containing protein [Anaerolineae bacterium]